MFFILLLEFPFNDKFNGVFKNTYNKKDISVVASGSRECFFSSLGNDVLTKPESVIDPEDELEWCSNINQTENDHSWLATRFRNKKLEMSGYSIKSGCCEYESIFLVGQSQDQTTMLLGQSCTRLRIKI